MSAMRQFGAHFKKDLLIEWRSRDAINSMLFFSLLVMFVFAIAFDPTSGETRAIAGGVIWIGLLFTITVALNQAWMRESRNNVLDGLRLAPADPAILFLGKAIANMVFVTALEMLSAPLFVVFFNLRPLGETWKLLLLMPLATWALVGNGTFFAVLSLRTRSREIMLPLILFPLSIPALLGAVQAMTAILTGVDSPDLWMKLLGGYDVIFTAASLVLFGTVVNAE